MRDLLAAVKNTGLSEKAAKVYLAALELGESTIQQLASRARLKRTTLYYTLTELLANGALIKTSRNRKIYYLSQNPKLLLKAARERLTELEDSLDALEQQQHSSFKKPRFYFLYGPAGFKQIWDMVLSTPEKEYRIITQGELFLDFVKEKYIMDEIIKTKKQANIFSKQLISDSAYARKIVAKDQRENRTTKLLPPVYKLPFTEIICSNFVAFISPRFENMLLVIENPSFARTRRSLFEITWNAL